ncbi:hypothetical protein Cgig2_016274 [Carnegiea gigantea]|uniref:Leucine-rich repeat-containing N-terminal plant-type domain-containing protein n=1 Tax=Carnegiea gigantea TaxID=171969 RepID=A0A9Q1KG88_9CARY|nr:hypothetical protein Cgig2_016274 [Carnegiea gigantea]
MPILWSFILKVESGDPPFQAGVFNFKGPECFFSEVEAECSSDSSEICEISLWVGVGFSFCGQKNSKMEMGFSSGVHQWRHSLAIVVFLVSLLLFGLGSVDSDDGATLLEIKKSIRDVDNVLYDWSDSPSSDYCIWRGVTCDNTTFNIIALSKSLSDILLAWWIGGVTCRNLSGLNLDGEISPAIGDLKNLLSMYGNLQFSLSLFSCCSVFICFACTCIGDVDKCYVNLSSDFSRNRLSGQIPDEIGDCSPLKSLDLSFNELYGDIPFSISKLKQLEALDLAQNNLTGDIPRLIYWNEVLQYLGLRGNNLGGTLSPDMCQLTGLWYFDVRNNSLSGSIPNSIGNCTAFQVLDLSYNQLSGKIPFNIGFLQVATLSSITTLSLDTTILLPMFRSLQGNQLSGEIPSVIGLMQALAVLDLSFNRLTGTIPPILGNLSYTEKLYLHGNKLTGPIPPELGNMSKLHYLYVSPYSAVFCLFDTRTCISSYIHLRLSIA